MRSSLLAFGVIGALFAVRAAAQSTSTPIAGSTVHSHVLATLPDSTFWPEGLDADPRTGKLYVASVRHRTIAEVDADGSTRELIARDRRDFAPIFGVRVDTARNVLWATMSGVRQIPGYVAADSAVAALLELRLSDGKILGRWDAPVAPGGRVLGDLAIGPTGDVFLSDSGHPVVYWLHAGRGHLDSIVSSDFRSLQGLAPTPDGRALYLADYSRGFFRVDLRTRAVTPIADLPALRSHGCDGILWFRDGILAIQNGVLPARVVYFALDKTGNRFTSATVIDQNSAMADEPTIGTILGSDFVYVANSQWEKHDAAGQRIPSKRLTPPLLLAVPLP
jgi:sugar lactone lactonase YvrE